MATAPTGYLPTRVDGQPSIAQTERALLCDYLDEVGPSRATLCEGWTTHHLAAHLAIREGGLADQVRNALGKGDELVGQWVGSHPFADVVEQVRQGPPRLGVYGIPGADRVLNTLEFLIHHEDARRGEEGWEPRVLPSWVEDALWSQVAKTAKLAMLRSKRSVTLARADADESVQVSKGSGSRVLTGLPSELALYVAGRRGAALVERADGETEPGA